MRNEGADVAAHDMIRRGLAEAEGMERLAAEYLTLATQAQQTRWHCLLGQSWLSAAELATVRASAVHGRPCECVGRLCKLGSNPTAPQFVVFRPERRD
jgi:hypothetical protein